VNDVSLHQRLRVDALDRSYQVWERNSLSTDLYTEAILIQKLNYLHNNPLQPRWNLAESPYEYKYSSAKFYETGIEEFGFLQHYKG
jgi:putative transposase